MRRNNKPKLEILKDLFWDYKWDSVIKNLDSPFVIARVLEIGNKEQVKEFLSHIGSEKIINFLKKYGNLLSKKSLNFWKLFYRIEKETTQKT